MKIHMVGAALMITAALNWATGGGYTSGCLPHDPASLLSMMTSALALIIL